MARKLLVCALVLLCAFSAQAWRISKDLEQEIKIKKAALTAHPKDPHAYFDLAITYAYTNNIQDGWNQLKKVVDIDPKFKAKGLEMYAKKVNASPNDWKLRFRLAFAYYFNERKQEAVRELKNVLILDPDNIWAYGYIALIYGELGDVDTAMEYTRRGLKIDSNAAALHLLLSEGHYKKGDGVAGWLERFEALRLRALGY